MKCINTALAILLSSSTITSAQTLPNKQNASLLAPFNIKIDGKVTEWADQFQAYNTATDVFYTIANDNDNLYLVVKAIKPRIIEKIIDVGVTLIVNTNGKPISIRYPAMSLKSGQRTIANVGIKSYDLPPNSRYDFKFDQDHADSLITAANNLLMSNAYQINLKGYQIKIISRLDIIKTGVPTVYKYNAIGEYDADQDLNSTTDFSAEYILAEK